jgi:hypothetical protein
MSSYFDDDREKILTSTLSTLQLQVDVIESLLSANRRLQEGLKAATRELERLNQKAETMRNAGIA